MKSVDKAIEDPSSQLMAMLNTINKRFDHLQCVWFEGKGGRILTKLILMRRIFLFVKSIFLEY